MSVRSELELAESHSIDLMEDDAHELEEHDFILDPDDGDRKQQVRALPPPPPPRRAGSANTTGNINRQPYAQAQNVGPFHRRSPSGVFPIAAVEHALAAALASPPVAVTAADAEISRLKAQLRARDAYAVGIERALDEWTGQLSAAGIHNVDDLAELVGRARGHAFRVAELEAELKQLAEQNAQLQAAATQRVSATKGREEQPAKSNEDARTEDDSPDSPLRRVRGIGRRYAKQLEALGIVHVDQIAAWTNADVARVAGELHIQPSRIKRECWIEQARTLGSNARVKSSSRSTSGRARQNHA
jgi:predicted flap endonuclease-1-like 5' DNA nuclease